MKKSLLALSLGLGLLAGTAHADEKATQNVSIVVSSASTMSQGMAMTLANQMQEQGAQVDILLCDAAGDLALKDAGGEALKPMGATPAKMLDAALAKGATASVCGLYLPNSGHSADDLRTGITAAKPADMAARMLEPGRKVIGF